MSAIYLIRMSPHGSSILPSAVEPESVGRATLRRRFTWTCSSRWAQPADHPTAGGLLHHLLTLTRNPPQKGMQAVVFFCPYLLSPIACIFTSGTPSAARTFLSRISWNYASGRPGQCFQNAKIIQKVKTTKHFCVFFFFSMLMPKIQTVVNYERGSVKL